MTKHLQPQLKNAKEIKSVLKEVKVAFELQGGRKVETLLVYLPIESGKSNHSDFFEKIKDGILYNFVFSCSEVENKLAVKNDNAAEELFEKSIRKLSKHTAKGELGELILFTLLDVYFKAPKILSKVSLKTSRKMPVFGADAVHAKLSGNTAKLYLGESKLYTNFKQAATKAASSIVDAKEKYEEEFDLLDSYMDFPYMNDKLQGKMLDLLDPFSDNNLSEVIHSPCFIGFSEPEIISSASSEADFIKKYTDLACDYVGDFFAKVEKNKMNINETSLLMLPFSCPDTLVNEFIAYLGIKE